MKIVYQAYGRADICQQAQFSLVTLKSFYPDGIPYQVEIYTDRKNELEVFFAGEMARPHPALSPGEGESSSVDEEFCRVQPLGWLRYLPKQASAAPSLGGRVPG